VLLVAAFLYLSRKKIIGTSDYTVKRTDFEYLIETKGEIQGKNNSVILLPEAFKKRDLWVNEFKIKDLVKEGTIVKTGDWVATLDMVEINRQIEENKDELARRKAELKDAAIDSAISLTSLREDIKETKFQLEYKAYELEQAKFESPAYQRKKNVEYDKSVRLLEKKRRDYELRKLELKTRMKRVEDRYLFLNYRDSILSLANEASKITSPKNGMIMYARMHGYRKIRVGDQISPWEPVIATIPDVAELISETFIEEIHITKVSIGDSVKITIDALPKKSYTGMVTQIANIGQEISGYESKVFKIVVSVNEHDSKLKPGMTSNNSISINKVFDVLTIPRECLFSDNGTKFVYLKKSGKIWKRKVITGAENDRVIIIKEGIAVKDKILTEPPNNSGSLVFK
jgi:multidrug efflux pump subunit AcrA (membrane-fusion protein)